MKSTHANSEFRSPFLSEGYAAAHNLPDLSQRSEASPRRNISVRHVFERCVSNIWPTKTGDQSPVWKKHCELSTARTWGTHWAHPPCLSKLTSPVIFPSCLMAGCEGCLPGSIKVLGIRSCTALSQQNEVWLQPMYLRTRIHQVKTFRACRHCSDFLVC